MKNFDYYFLNSVTGNLLTLILTINSYSEDSKFLKDEHNAKINEASIHLMNLVNSFGKSLDSFYSIGEESSTEIQISNSYQNTMSLKDELSEGINYSIKLVCDDKAVAERPDWTFSLFKFNAGTVLDTDCNYKSCQLLHTWTRENLDLPVQNVLIKTGETLFLFSNFMS